jgi:hypothetical protein
MTTLDAKLDTKTNDDIQFSWKSVLKRWGQNMRDDMDPALTGLKGANYMFHGIPTWIRETREGKMSPDSSTFAYTTGAVAGALIGGGYYMVAKIAGDAIAASGHSPHWGYLAAAVPIAASQGVSWSYEAFRRAKNTEKERVVMTRLQRLMDSPSPSYAVSGKALIEQIADELQRGGDVRSRRGIEDTSDGVTEAKKTVALVANDIFQGLVANNQVGSTYEMAANDLHVGPEKRRRGNEYDNSFNHKVGIVANVIREAVERNGGSATFELLGTVTAVYGGNEDKRMSYQVKPNEVWRV